MTKHRSLVTLLIALCGVLSMATVTQYAVRGTHQPSGNVGYLGTPNAAVYGEGVFNGVYASATDSDGSGVTGQGYYGVSGSPLTTSGIAVLGTIGITQTGTAIWGSASATAGNVAVYGNATAPALAGKFQGNVSVIGTLSKSAGSFKIDHPLFPAERYLSHSFVESPDMKNIYDGIATLDRDGSAVVELPAWFQALNEDFRYQLTCIGENAPVFIAEEIADNRFRIGGGHPGMRVSWLVTGIRHDRYARAYRIPVEEEKQLHERGRFLHPELYGVTEAQSVDFEQAARLRAKRR